MTPKTPRLELNGKATGHGDQPVRAVLYARVSSAEQEKEGFSIPAQQRLLRDYARANNIVVAEEFVDVETAKAAGRTGFNAMLDYVKKHNRSVRSILVEKTDRLYRNISDWALLDGFGLNIHFVKEATVIGPDSRSSEQFVHGIKVLMARNYSQNLSEETRKGMTEKARAGIYPSCAPTGYRNVDGPDGKRVIVRDDKEAQVVTELFSLFATGNFSLKTLAAYCRTRGIRMRGKSLHVASLHLILRRRMYMGEFEWNGTVYKGIHEPLTTPEIWTRVQMVLDGRNAKHTGAVRREFPFAGLVSCGHCGCAMVAELKKGKYIYYHCTGFRGKCPEPYTRQEALIDEFGSVLSRLVIPEEILAWLAQAVNESDTTEAKAREAALRSSTSELNRLTHKLDTLYEDRLEGRITKQFYDDKAAAIESQRVELTRRVDEIRNASLPPLTTAVDIARLTSRACAAFRGQTEGEQRKLLTLVLKDATWKDGQLQTTLFEPFEQLRLSNRLKANEISSLGTSSAEFSNWLPKSAGLRTVLLRNVHEKSAVSGFELSIEKRRPPDSTRLVCGGPDKTFLSVLRIQLSYAP